MCEKLCEFTQFIEDFEDKKLVNTIFKQCVKTIEESPAEFSEQDIRDFIDFFKDYETPIFMKGRLIDNLFNDLLTKEKSYFLDIYFLYLKIFGKFYDIPLLHKMVVKRLCDEVLETNKPYLARRLSEYIHRANVDVEFLCGS